MSSTNIFNRTTWVLLLLILTTTAPTWAGKTINKKGRRIEIKHFLVPGKINIFQFHLPSNRMSKKLLYELNKYEQKHSSKVAVFTVNLGYPGSPVAKQYNITSFPTFYIFDEKGNLDKTGGEAYTQVIKWLEHQ